MTDASYMLDIMQMYLHMYEERGLEHDREEDCIDVHNLSKLQVTSCENTFTLEFAIVL